MDLIPTVLLLPPYLPTDPYTLCSDISLFLIALQSDLSSTPRPYLHQVPISFTNKTTKQNWAASLPDSDYRHTFSQFWKGFKKPQSTWLAVFHTWNQTWVGDLNWDSSIWHCWGIAIIKSPKGQGKHLILWDCDPVLQNHKADFHYGLLSLQRKFIKFANQQGHLSSIWYNQDISFSGQDQCLKSTLLWIQKLFKYGDYPFQGLNDLRIKGCIQLK
jgi:hypothetical protein